MAGQGNIMSEQTPDTNNGISEGQDPSMEDILASIRKIIAEDDVQSEVGLDANLGVVETQALTGDVSELVQADSLDLDIIDDDIIDAPDAQFAPANTDVDNLIGDMDAEGDVDIMALPIETVTSSEDNFDVLDLEIPMGEPEVAIDEAINLAAEEPLMLDEDIAEMMSPIEEQVSLEPAAAIVSQDEITEGPQDDLSLMLDNMLEDSAPEIEPEIEVEAPVIEAPVIEAPVIEERVFDPAEDLLAEIDLVDEVPDEIFEETATSETDPDMDLVKSLMADLTEEPLHDEIDVDEFAIADIDDDMDAASDDVMDEILSMTLDDETKLSEEIAIPEIEAPILESASPEGLSLKEIAAQADADAKNSGSGILSGLVAAAGVGAVSAAATAGVQDAAAPEIGEPEVDEPEVDDVDSVLSEFDEFLADETDSSDDLTPPIDLSPEEPETLTPETLIEETPQMARAKKSDAIIDEVTETATAGAFASLNQVVEDKATVAERGDRIGDIVMEALQPMLKEWLDANLKGIVERAVTKEVKRISSGK